MPARKKKAKPAAHAKSADRAGAARFSARPVWQGHLRLSLVSCSVALYGATSRAGDISFHLLNPETNNRIRMVPTDPDSGPVERAHLVKGYEVSKNRYVVLNKDELDAIKLETTHTIEIERFVAAGEIDRLYWNDPYYLVPSEKPGMEAYAVIREALAEAGRIALGRVVMHTRERLVALEPRDKGIMVHTLRTADEVVNPAEAFADLPGGRPDKRMVEIALKIVAQQEGPFEPTTFEDRYENALRDLIRRKERGEKLIAAEPVEEDNVIDLMAALRRSLNPNLHWRCASAPEDGLKWDLPVLRRSMKYPVFAAFLSRAEHRPSPDICLAAAAERRQKTIPLKRGR